MNFDQIFIIFTLFKFFYFFYFLIAQASAVIPEGDEETKEHEQTIGIRLFE